MKLRMFGTLGRATVPADIGRHGGRPYDSTRSKFVFRMDPGLYIFHLSYKWQATCTLPILTDSGGAPERQVAITRKQRG